MDERFIRFPIKLINNGADIFRMIDPSCQVVEEGLLISFPEQFIEVGDLFNITEGIPILDGLIPEAKLPDNLRPYVPSPYTVHELENRWMQLRKNNPHREQLIREVLDYYSFEGAIHHFTYVKIVNIDFALLTRFPKLLYHATKESRGDLNRIVKEDRGGYLLPNALDFVRYPHLFLSDSFLHTGIPLNNGDSTIYFLGNNPITVPWWAAKMQGDIPSGNRFLDENIDSEFKEIKLLNTRAQYDLIKLSAKVVNNWLAFIFNPHNFKDDHGTLDCSEMIKAQISLNLFMEGLFSNKYVDNTFFKIANSFRLLDQFSNMILGLSKIPNSNTNERELFSMFFKEGSDIYLPLKELFPESDNSLKKCLEGLFKKVFESLREEPEEDLKSFRNMYTHGAYPNSDKNKPNRFEILFDRKENVSKLIFLLPQILFMASGANPKKFIEKIDCLFQSQK